VKISKTSLDVSKFDAFIQQKWDIEPFSAPAVKKRIRRSTVPGHARIPIP
jgi:hypothetical protein